MLRACIHAGLILIAGVAYCQTAGKSPAFDAASVKPAKLPAPDASGTIRVLGGSPGGPGTNDPGRIHYAFITLKMLIVNAYDVKVFQITGPPWLDSERFELTATMPPNTTKEQFRLMLQNLLAERFQLAVHRETKELPMYSLVVAKSGPKLKGSGQTAPVSESVEQPSAPPRIEMGTDGFPVMPELTGRRGIIGMMMNGRARWIANQATMQDLADRLSNQFSRPVKDETGLTGKYNFILTYAPDGMPGPAGPSALPPPGAVGPTPASPPAGSIPDEPLPSLSAAIQSQLGLKLESGKGPVEVIVIDHAEKTPTEN